jgi:hypothetical protein
VACDVAPSGDKPTELCAQVTKCLLNKGDRDDEFGVITAVEDCEGLARVSDAPADTGLVSVGFVTVTGELGEVPAEGIFLFARSAAGLCLVDRVLNMEWFHGGSFENEVKTRWDGSRLHIEAQRMKRIPLDRSQEDSPGADVDWITCDRLVYDVADGKLRRVKAEGSDRACRKRAR